MNDVKEELASAKLVRKNRQEYEALARIIKEKPSRTDSVKTLKRLQEELDENCEKQKELEQRVELLSSENILLIL